MCLVNCAKGCELPVGSILSCHNLARDFAFLIGVFTALKLANLVLRTSTFSIAT
jgi:hypothetical protein